MLLKLDGHETHTAYDGLEAVEAAASVPARRGAARHRPAELNGYEVARRIREQPWGKAWCWWP